MELSLTHKHRIVKIYVWKYKKYLYLAFFPRREEKIAAKHEDESKHEILNSGI